MPPFVDSVHSFKNRKESEIVDELADKAELVRCDEYGACDDASLEADFGIVSACFWSFRSVIEYRIEP
jgi:hypothetical protein